MLLFKSSGATYMKVVRQSIHAFLHNPVRAREDEFVMLSKNREDCSGTEKQIQWVGKVLEVNRATPAQLDKLFPGVDAGRRFRYTVKLYWVRKLTKPFNLPEIRGLNARRYNTVQDFARLDSEDEPKLLKHLVTTNPDVILDFLNNVKRP